MIQQESTLHLVLRLRSEGMIVIETKHGSFNLNDGDVIGHIHAEMFGNWLNDKMKFNLRRIIRLIILQ